MIYHHLYSPHQLPTDLYMIFTNHDPQEIDFWAMYDLIDVHVCEESEGEWHINEYNTKWDNRQGICTSEPIRSYILHYPSNVYNNSDNIRVDNN